MYRRPLVTPGPGPGPRLVACSLGHNAGVTSTLTTGVGDPWHRAADGSRRVGRRVEFHPVIGSTNDRAREALSERGGDGLAVVADLQTGGRGRRGRAWLSPAGRNLMLSVGCRPLLSPAATGWLGAATALAVRDACQAATGTPLAVRWPNDIVTAEGEKLAGLLVETAIDGESLSEAVIGIGINVNWPRAEMPVEIAARSTSLLELAGAELDRVELLRAVLDRLDDEVALLMDGVSPVPRLAEALAFHGRLVTLEQGDAVLEGVATGLDEDGALLLDTADGRRAVTAGEVVRVRDAGERA